MVSTCRICTTIIFAAVLLAELTVRGQKYDPSLPNVYGGNSRDSRIMDLSDDARNGDRAALVKLADYLPNDSLFERSDGHMYDWVNAFGIYAMSCLHEHVPCLRKDIDLYPADSARIRSEFFDNLPKLQFDSTTGLYIRTPEERISTGYVAYWLPDGVLKKLAADTTSRSKYDTLQLRCYRCKEIWGWGGDTAYRDYLRWATALYERKDPRILAEIAKGASEKPNNVDFYAGRPEVELITMLTGVVLLEPGKAISTSYEFYDKEKFFTYWKEHYNEYKWDAKRRLFVNVKVPAKEIQADPHVGELLHKTGPLSRKEFMFLAESEPEKLAWSLFDIYAGEKEFERMPERLEFVNRLAPALWYCKQNGIPWRWPSKFDEILAPLKNEHLGIGERTRLEDQLLEHLTYDDITPLEYWFFTDSRDEEHGERRPVNGSVARILNKLYAANWSYIVNNEKQFQLYLVKAGRFDVWEGHLYLDMDNIATYSPELTDSMLRVYYAHTNDQEVKNKIAGILWVRNEYRRNLRVFWQREPWHDKPEVWQNKGSNERFDNLIKRLRKDKRDYNKFEWDISHCDYDQLGDVIEYFSRDSIYDYELIHFLVASRFGFPVDSIRTRDDMLRFYEYYKITPQMELYKYYLEQAGYRCWDSAGNLELDKAYYIIRYNYTWAFSDETAPAVYAVIKLLEQKLGTSLGYPPVNSKCDAFFDPTGLIYDQCWKWQVYLEEHKLVKQLPRSLFSPGLPLRDYSAVNHPDR